jgi:hypothetical protein
VQGGFVGRDSQHAGVGRDGDAENIGGIDASSQFSQFGAVRCREDADERPCLACCGEKPAVVAQLHCSQSRSVCWNDAHVATCELYQLDFSWRTAREGYCSCA